jgi:hypothetical protein
MFDSLISVFYFFFGVFATIYFSILFKKKVKQNDLIQKPNGYRIFLNLFFLNGKEVVENLVRSKISKKSPVARALAKRLMVRLVTDERLVGNMGAELSKTIPERLAISGIHTTVNIVYAQSAFVCFEILINKIDIPKTIETSSGVQAGINTKKFLEKYSFKRMDDFLNRILLNIVGSKLMVQLPIMIREKLMDKLQADIVILALNDEEQGPFIIQTINQLNNNTEQLKKSASVEVKPKIENKEEVLIEKQ